MNDPYAPGAPAAAGSRAAEEDRGNGFRPRRVLARWRHRSAAGASSDSRSSSPILALLVANNMRPIYRSTVTLPIEQGRSKVVSIEEVYSQGRHPARVSTTRHKSRSRGADELARKVVEEAELLQSHPDFPDVRQTPPTFLNRVMGTAVADPSQVPEEEVIRRAIGRFKRGPAGGPSSANSQLVVVSFLRPSTRILRPGCRTRLHETFIESDPRITHGHDAESGPKAAAPSAWASCAREGGCLGKGAAGLSRPRAASWT